MAQTTRCRTFVRCLFPTTHTIRPGSGEILPFESGIHNPPMSLTLHHFQKEFRYLRWRWLALLPLGAGVARGVGLVLPPARLVLIGLAGLALATVFVGPVVLDTYSVNVLTRSLLYAAVALTVVAIVILVFFGLGYLFGRLFL